MLRPTTDTDLTISTTTSPGRWGLREALAPSVATSQGEPASHVIVQAAASSEAGIVRCAAVALHSGTRQVLGSASYDFDHVVSQEAGELQALVIGLRKARQLGARRVSAQTESRLAHELMTGRVKAKDETLRAFVALAEQEAALLERVFYERITAELNTVAREIADWPGGAFEVTEAMA